MIFNIRITDTDAPMYRNRDPIKVLAAHEKEKKDKYLEDCLARRRHFTPLVFSIDGLRGVEATAASGIDRTGRVWIRSIPARNSPGSYH